MARLCLFIALIIQNAFVFSIELTLEKNDGDLQTFEYENDSIDDLRSKPKPALDAEAKEEFFNTFFAQNSHIYPSSSVAMMNQVQDSEKPPAEQLEDIKAMASKITMSIQSELANLLSFAITGYDKISEDKEDKETRAKRSAETPVDSAQLISRLLKHIKSNNDYQNIAIEKMMSAKEIADKYNIDFKPDPEILTDFAEASNKQAQELNEILTDVCEARNASIEHSFVSLDDSSNVSESYYHYDVQPEGQCPAHQGFVSLEEYVPQEIQRPVNPHHHHHQHFETQVLPPPVQPHHHCSPPVSQRPNVFDPQEPFTPAPQYYPAFESLPVVIFEEIYEPEPEIVGEEYEETVTSKVVVEQGDEPGSSTVNHVMTYTLSEKAHFRTPQIERLPEQVQYYFLMM